MLNQETRALLSLLIHLLPCSLGITTENVHIKKVQSEPQTNLESLWMDILEGEYGRDQTVLISNSNYHISENITSGIILIEVNELNISMPILHTFVVKENGYPLYIILDIHLTNEDRTSLIEIIRETDKQSPIVTYWSGVRSYISNNVFFVSKNNFRLNTYNIYETCSYCFNGKHQIKITNEWSFSKGFKNKFSLVSSFKGSFYGAKLLIAYRNSPGIFSRIGVGPSGKPILTGYLYGIMALVGKQMKFQLEVIEPPDGKIGEVIDGKPDGMLGMVSTGKADIGAAFLFPSWDRYQFVDFSASYDTVDDIIVSDEPERSLDFFAFIQPFSSQLWTVILLSVPVVALALYIVNKFSPGQVNRFTFSECLWQAGAIIAWDSTTLKSPSVGTILILICYIWSCFLIITFFTGEITSLMTAEPYKYPPINSMEEFKALSEMKWISHKSYVLTKKLKESSTSMKSRYVHPGGTGAFLTSHITAMTMMLNEPRTYIFPVDRLSVTAAIDLYFVDTTRENKFYISNIPFSSNHLMVFLQKHTSYQNTFNIHLLRLQEVGIVYKLMQSTVDMYKKMGRGLAKTQKRFPEPKQSDSFKLKHMYGSLVLYAVGNSVALIAMLSECLYFYLCKKAIH